MATRSFIAIENNDGSIETIYCHWDGSPKTNGETLVNHYRSEKKVRALIALGGLSSVHKKLNPPKGKEHSFDFPIKNVTVAYGRDRGAFKPSRKYKSFKSYKRIWNTLDGEYFYVYAVDTKEWVCYSVRENGIMVDLTQYKK